MTTLQQPNLCPPSTTRRFVQGRSFGMRHFDSLIHEIARTDIPVILTGESGSGKDAYARQIHQLSLKSNACFQKLNCASLDPSSLSAFLAPGSNSSALDGTLYLDNLRDLDSECQRLLLKCLSSFEDLDLGEQRLPRLVSSTLSPLESEVELGQFRQELYFRLDGACLRVPPLRERLEDVEPLAEHFLNRFSTTLGRAVPSLTPDVVHSLCAYHWPGNVRELENVTRNAVLFGDFRVVLDQLRAQTPNRREISLPGSPTSLKFAARAASKRTERELIIRTLERTHWNRKKAARELQVSYKSLLGKIKQIGLSPDGQEG